MDSLGEERAKKLMVKKASKLHRADAIYIWWDWKGIIHYELLLPAHYAILEKNGSAMLYSTWLQHEKGPALLVRYDNIIEWRFEVTAPAVAFPSVSESSDDPLLLHNFLFNGSLISIQEAGDVLVTPLELRLTMCGYDTYALVARKFV
ncbi:hypothetical protein EVAR_83899_1 [Eumeta japonica]|uniref:Uncharacterized protein n=1 Tax=Eumeta variegata TaxID=151549 RepID=A0A4C1URP9_EUMVA|nr:hypothetical protein EVAR_83899_1 [Eumeta japonica]